MGELLTTSEIADLLRVSPATVRRWADTGVLAYERTAGGHRRFSREDVDRVARERGGAEARVERWVELLVRSDRALGVDAALLASRSEVDGWYAVAEELAPVLEEIGARWERGELTLLAEHLASARLGRALARVVDTLPLPHDAPRALLATPPAEAHTLGLALVEVCLREQGWATLWAGRETPARELAARVLAGDVAAVVVSASACSAADALRGFSDELARPCSDARAPLVVGGHGPWPDALAHGAVIRTFQGLREWLGAARRGPARSS